MASLSFFVKYFREHDIFKYLQIYNTVDKVSDVDRALLQEIEGKKFLLLHIRSTNSYIVIFKHIDKDIIPTAKEALELHPYGCRIHEETGENDVEEPREFVFECNVEIFSSCKLCESEIYELYKKHPSVHFEFDSDYEPDISFENWSHEKEIVFVALMRILNFDLHFHETLCEISITSKTERHELIYVKDGGKKYDSRKRKKSPEIGELH